MKLKGEFPYEPLVNYSTYQLECMLRFNRGEKPELDSSIRNELNNRRKEERKDYHGEDLGGAD